MAKNTQQSILVYTDWVGLEQPTLMGILHSSPVRGKEVFSFEYDDVWLLIFKNF